MAKSKSEVQNEALPILLPLKRSGAAISMGVGKSLLGLRHMDAQYNEGGRLFLVVAPKKSIFQSWKDDAVAFKMDHLLPFIKFCTYVSLPKQTPVYHTVYLDECHSLLYNHQRFLDNYDGKILGLTGTAPKWENSEKGLMVNQYCPIAYEYITDDAVEDGILNDYRIIVHTIELAQEKTYIKKTKAGGQWATSELADYNYWTNQIGSASTVKKEQIMRIMRMKALMTYPTKENYARHLFQRLEEKSILFCNTIAQAHKLAAHSYTSKNPKSEENLEMFKDGTIDKLSCVLQLSEGVNILGLKAGIIMHSYGNERKSAQRIGRLLRLNPIETAEMHILCYKNTVDEKWTKAALSEFDQSKITWKESQYTEI